MLFLRASGAGEDFTGRWITVEKQTFRRGQFCFLFYSFSWSSDATKLKEQGLLLCPTDAWTRFRIALKWTVHLLEYSYVDQSLA